MPRGRMEADAAMWRERVQRWKASGLTARQFSEQEGIERHTALSWWCHRLKQLDTKDAGAEPALKLIQLHPVVSKHKRGSGQRQASAVSIECGAYRVNVDRDFDEELLRRVLVVLESAR